MDKRVKRIEHYFSAHPKSKKGFGLIRARLRGRPFQFLTASGVFSRHRVDLGTRLLIESMVLPERGCVLDMGCGYGTVGIAAASLNPRLHVILVDVNARAVWLAKQNFEMNSVRNAEVRRGCLYAPVKDCVFDCILSNPPVSAGMATVEAIIREAPLYMRRKALFQMVVRSKVGGQRLREFFECAFGTVEVLARGSGYRVLISEKNG
jgi:16S rRNA (guanine1207-N2)-methyltransferase